MPDFTEEPDPELPPGVADYEEIQVQEDYEEFLKGQMLIYI